jgi:hypothetical protein
MINFVRRINLLLVKKYSRIKFDKGETMQVFLFTILKKYLLEKHFSNFFSIEFFIP